MNDTDSAYYYLCMLAAIVILPASYMIVLREMKRSKVSSPPEFEFFVFFGTVGGWLLFVAVLLVLGGAPSAVAILTTGMVLAVIVAFSLLVAFPTGLFLFILMLHRPAVTRFHTVATWALGTVVAPLALLLLFIFGWTLLSPFFESVRF